MLTPAPLFPRHRVDAGQALLKFWSRGPSRRIRAPLDPPEVRVREGTRSAHRVEAGLQVTARSAVHHARPALIAGGRRSPRVRRGPRRAATVIDDFIVFSLKISHPFIDLQVCYLSKSCAKVVLQSFVRPPRWSR